jgi:hypothetical protein
LPSPPSFAIGGTRYEAILIAQLIDACSSPRCDDAP